MDWRAYLQGDDHDLHIVRSAFIRGDLTAQQDDDGTYLVGSAFSALSVPAEVLIKVDELLPTINGICRLVDIAYKPVTSQGRIKDPQGQVAIFAEARLYARGDLSIGGEASIAERMLSLVDSTAELNEIVRLLGTSPELNWFDLYKLYELLRQAAGGRERDLAARVQVSEQRLDAFRASANRADVSGIAARHAVDRGTTPRRTMSLPEARSLIVNMIRAWRSPSP